MPIVRFTEDDLRPREDLEVTRDKIDSLRQYGRGLTKWEREFLESIEEQLHRRGFLTGGQQTILDRLYDQHLF